MAKGNNQQRHFFVSEAEQEYLRKLIAKHGDDFKGMERDIKLNVQQHSKAKLRRRVARLAVFDKQQAAKAAEEQESESEAATGAGAGAGADE